MKLLTTVEFLKTARSLFLDNDVSLGFFKCVFLVPSAKSNVSHGSIIYHRKDSTVSIAWKTKKSLPNYLNKQIAPDKKKIIFFC